MPAKPEILLFQARHCLCDRLIQIQPLRDEGTKESVAPRIGQQTVNLPVEHFRIAKLAAGGQCPQFAIRRWPTSMKLNRDAMAY
jgi:hypothetical protein